MGNLAEFGEQDSKTDLILKIIEKRIDELDIPYDVQVAEETYGFECALELVKEMLK